MKLPKLYKKTSTGAIQSWEISVEGATIITHYGQVGGKIQEARDTIREGKNLGRANETTPAQQAELEAKSQYTKKKDKGYVEDLKQAKAGKTDIDGGIFPMLAKTFSKDGDKIVYPAYVQPKFDGHRCTGNDTGLWARSRKPIESLPHLNKAIKTARLKDIQFLDGELYNHEYRDKFEELTHFIRQEEPIDGCEIVQYHVYDVAMDGTFEKRWEWLKKNLPKSPYLILVETIEVKDEDELMTAFEHFVAQGYEGAIVRNAKGLYVNRRTADLQKIKEFLDDEFPIVGIEEGRGKLTGHVGKFLCKTKEGKTFGAKLKGELAKLKEYFDNPKLWEGKILTIQFQGYTKYKVPRFPVGLRIRVDI